MASERRCSNRERFIAAARAFALGLSVSMAPGDVAAQSPPVRGTASISIDLGSSAIAGVLPFDEPFVLAGVPGPILQELLLHFDVAQNVTRETCKKSYVFQDTAASWKRSQFANDSFRLKIPALLPNKSYGFCFRTLSKLSAEDSARFINKARATIQMKARQWVLASASLANIPDDSLRALAGVLRRELLSEFGGRYELTIPGGSILAENPSSVAIGTAFGAFKNPNCQRVGLARGLSYQALADPRDSIPTVEFPGCLDASTNPAGADRSTVASALDTLRKSTAFAPFIEALATIPPLRFPEEKTRALVLALWRLRSANAQDLGNVAFGRVSLDDPRSPVAGLAAPLRIVLSSSVAPWRVNLANTAGRLSDALVAGDAVAGAMAAAVGPRDRARAAASQKAVDEVLTLLRIAVENVALQQDQLRQFIDALDALNAAGSDIANTVVPTEVTSVVLEGTTFGSYETRARWHISQDIGILYGWHPDDVRATEAYAGVNIYVRPVNRNAHVGPLCALVQPLRCISMTLGTTLGTVAEEGRYRGVLGGKAAVVGVGTRIGDFLRVAYVRPIVYSYSQSQPRRQRVAALHGISASIDADLKDVLGSLGKALFP